MNLEISKIGFVTPFALALHWMNSMMSKADSQLIFFQLSLDKFQCGFDDKFGRSGLRNRA